MYLFQNTSKLIRSSDWTGLDEVAILKIYEQVVLLICVHTRRHPVFASNNVIKIYAAFILFLSGLPPDIGRATSPELSKDCSIAEINFFHKELSKCCE